MVGEPLLARMPNIPIDSLTTLDVIGSGQFGKVLKALLLQDDEEEVEVAVKFLKVCH